MLNVQKFLKGGKTFEDLAQYGVLVKKHPTEDLYILDYDQIESKINHPISDECRGLVLDGKFNVVSGCMRRFYNVGQSAEYDKLFDWSDFSAFEKRDGSMIGLFRYKDRIFVRTRFSWADSELPLVGKTWEQLVMECLTETQKELFLTKLPYDTFIFELETPWNQVVLYHEKPQLVLLTIIHVPTYREWSPLTVDQWASVNGFKRPKRFEFKNMAEAQVYLDTLEAQKIKDEGIVFMDKNFRRLKLKNKYYMMYHSMCTGIQSIRQVYEIVTNPNIDKEEVGLYFPHLKPKFDEVQKKIDAAFAELWNVWFMTQDFEEQKKFALAITKPDSKFFTRFSSILFRCREIEGAKQPADFCLREQWAKSKDLIFKVLFKE